MGKSRRGDKERSREQELKYEVHKLRRQVSSLRKQLARVDLDRYSHIKDIVQEHMLQEEAVSAQDMLEKEKQAWRCHEGGCVGFLEIILYTKMSETWYFRKCSHCSNRTKSQTYTPSVRGIIKQPDPDPKK